MHSHPVKYEASQIGSKINATQKEIGLKKKACERQPGDAGIVSH